MDYCSTCRRHLNGALVCPGCGAYAPDIAPPTVDSRYVPVTAVPAAWHGGGLRDETAVEDTAPPAPHEDAPVAPESVPAAPQGRAARRRQLARWKKNQRRAVVATAVALVGGGLTVASLDRHTTDRAQAAAAPDDRTMGAAPERATEYGVPESAPSTRRSSARNPRAASPVTTTPQQRYAATAPRSTVPRTDPASPHPVTNSAPPARNDTASSSQETVTDPAGTAVQQTADSATTPGTDTGSAQSGTAQSGTAQSGSAPASSSPTELCVLVLCLG